jgi:hypothetical protein
LSRVAELLESVTDLGGSVTLEAGKLKARVPADRPDLLETLKANRDAVLEHLSTRKLERLPAELEALLRAASNGSLPTGSTKLDFGVCPDLSTFTTTWALAYLLGSPDALGHLWNAHRAWSKHLNARLN